VSSSSFGFLITFSNLFYIVSQLLLLVVAAYFWKRYPRPSLYLAIMASLEVFGSVLQTALQFVFNWGLVSQIDVIFLHVFASSIALAVHFLLDVGRLLVRRSQLRLTLGQPAGSPR